MVARPFWSIVVSLLYGLLCVFALEAMPADAATQLGGLGTGSGKTLGAAGVALDQATGDVYVADRLNFRVNKWDGTGHFLMTWGWAVSEEAPASELQTCTAFCQSGSSGTGAGQFGGEGPQGVAVDSDPLSSSYGAVYVVDYANYRVEKFDSSGKFLSMFGGGVNETKDNTPGASEAEKDVCVAGEACTKGIEGMGNGQFSWAFLADGVIAVGPQGRVYVGDKARVEVFEASGAWRENISLSSMSSTGKVTALAVDPAGNMFVKDQTVSGVRELEPSGVEKVTQFDAGSTSVEAITLDETGNVYVADSKGGLRFLMYDPSGNERESFGSQTASSAHGMAFSAALGDLYVADHSSGNTVWVLAVPVPGPLVEPGSESATPEQRGKATLAAKVNPEGSQTTYRFEYVDEALYQATGFASASSTASVTVASGLFEDGQASAVVSGLLPGGAYRCRIVATNANGTTTGPDQTFTTIPAALVDGPWASDLTATSATFAARIDPLGANTQYRLEYGTSTSYGQTLSGSVGEGTSYVVVSYHRQGLQPATTYHYRLVTSNEVGTIEGADETFTTQGPGAQLALPDGRSWELVSPADKRGALIEFFHATTIEAASDGSGIAYDANEPIGEVPNGREGQSQILSTHSSDGWHTATLDVPGGLVKEGTPYKFSGSNPEYRLFSSDLSLAAVQPPLPSAPLSTEATERTIYRWDHAAGSYRPLVTSANVPPGTKFEGNNVLNEMFFLDATPDLSRIVVESPFTLATEAVGDGGTKQYEWSDGKLQLIDVLPNEKAASGHLGRWAGLTNTVARSMSSDGRWVVWTTRGTGLGEVTGLYLRDMVQRKTTRIGGQYPLYQAMSSDGSRVFFVEDGDLYVFDARTSSQADITASHGVGESTAGVRDGLLGIAQDGSYVYFVATGALAEGSHGGEDNLYAAHYEGSGWKTTYVATLSGNDEKDWMAGAPEDRLQKVTSRVSPSGRFATFMSERSLTGYDNHDAISGEPDVEVYLYDAVTGRLACVSCNPTGARPLGVLDGFGNKELLVDRPVAWTRAWSNVNHWLAGNVPTWEEVEGYAVYQPRFLSNSGRLFFDSPDALVPQDSNGLEDVYEYEPVGVGGCALGGAGFNQSLGGCVSLLSAGTSSTESAFYDASESGEDAFFITTSRLTTEDYDRSYDLYDARVCSPVSPCRPALVSPPPCTSGDSCKAAPSPQPAIFGPAPSATFSGQGNVASGSAKPAVRQKSNSRARRLARALGACHKKASKRKRIACERRVRKRYGVKQAVRANDGSRKVSRR